LTGNTKGIVKMNQSNETHQLLHSFSYIDIQGECIMNKILIAVVIVISLVVAGCSADNGASMMTNTNTSKFTVTPPDGATGVRLDAGITMSFEKPVDRDVVEWSLHLFSQQDMMDSTCPMSAMAASGMMDSAMVDSMSMNHLISSHGTPVHLEWNSVSTVCIVRPDSMMMGDMRYMIHLGPDMMQMLEARMGDMGMMAGHGEGMMARNMMIHFQTMSASSGVHDDHH
jgi:hypothetical protein